MTKKRKPHLKRPLLKHEILEAQRNAVSANDVARKLEVDIRTYKKYAQLYGIYENVLNPEGFGTPKGFAKSNRNSITLRDIFDNKHPNYPIQRLRWRMIKRGLIEDRCENCGMDEGRITDNKRPIMMVFRDEKNDYRPENLQMLCYNCCFLILDTPYVANKNLVKSSVSGQRKQPKYRDTWYRPEQQEVGLEPLEDLTDEEIEELKRQIDEELGR